MRNWLGWGGIHYQKATISTVINDSFKGLCKKKLGEQTSSDDTIPALENKGPGGVNDASQNTYSRVLRIVAVTVKGNVCY
jgi:hypothetical protein